MSDQVYFIGYRPEQFTGWDGTGSASYTSVSSTNSTDPNNIGSISLTTSGNVLWKDLDISGLDPVYISAALFSTYYSDTENHSEFVITDGANAISLINSTPGDHTREIYLNVGTYDITKRFTSVNSTNIYASPQDFTLGVQSRFFLKFYSSNGVTYDKIDVCGTSTANLNITSSVTTITLSNPFTSIKSMYSDHISKYSTFFYCIVSNFDLTGSYIDYTTVASSGTFDDWSGTVSTLDTYPINSSVTTNGVYSYNQGDQITFNPTKQLTVGSGMMSPKAVFIDSSLSSTAAGYEATSIVKNKTSSITYNLGETISTTTTPIDYQWVSYQNPSNLSNWSVSDVNTMEFGLKRIS